MYGLQKGSQLIEAFVKTADKNVVDWYEVQKSEVYLDKLQQKIVDVQQQIDAAPKPITEIPPNLSTEILQAIEEYNIMILDVTEIEEYKVSLEELLSKAKNAESAGMEP